jgi:hypothetical protein
MSCKTVGMAHDGSADASDYYTLLGVRLDGAVPVVDMAPVADHELARRRAAFLLREHASCSHIEIWKDGALVEALERQPAP